MAIFYEGNVIFVSGVLGLPDLPRLLAAIHNVTTVRKNRSFTLDFTNCTATYAGPMLGLAAHVQSKWAQGIDVSLTLPSDTKLARLFQNSNWANLIDFRSFEPSRFKGTSQVPAIRFQSGTEQHAAVEKIVDILFGALTGLSRNDFRALEWSINEITDNVMNHAQSKVGGFIQVTNFFAKAKRIEFAVADPGIGIPTSLKAGHPEIHTDQEALDRAIREGITRSSQVGQGNGLFGTWRITQISAGRLNILSGRAALSSDPVSGLHIIEQQIPFDGCLVVANIPYAQPIDLGEAFRFGGRKQVPTDFVDLRFEVNDKDQPILLLEKESSGFGSRDAGKIARNKIMNLLTLSDSNVVVVDLQGVPLISSSYADEVFGMMFLSMGPLKFSQSIQMINVDPLVENLINRAIMQRMKQ